MIFRSKVDTWIAVVLVLATIGPIWGALLVISTANPVALVIAPALLLGPAFVAWVLSTTYYVVSESDILVRSGPVRRLIPFEQITRIEKTRNPISSPALSLDRMAISYGQRNVCIISPRDHDGFIKALRSHGVRAAWRDGRTYSDR